MHAVLSPSSAERWITCPGSVRLVKQAQADGLAVDRETEYAEEGTLAHTVAEIKAGLAYGLLPPKVAEARLLTARREAEARGWDFEEMELHAASYVALIDSLTEGRENPQLLTEQRVESGIPGCWGTADASIIGLDGILDVIDYKYGVGVVVEAIENPQAMLYGLGVMDMIAYLDDIELVRLTIHQPRVRTGEPVSTWIVSAKDLREWREAVARPMAALALSDDGFLQPSEKGCRWCPVAGTCKARMEFVTKRAFGSPDLLTPEEIAEQLDDVGQIEAWCKALRETALKLSYERGVEIPRWKVGRAAGRRSIVDMDKAIARLRRAGYGSRQTTKKALLTLGELENLVGGRAKLDELAGDAIKKGEGSLSLIPADDPREGLTSAREAAQVFNDESE